VAFSRVLTFLQLVDESRVKPTVTPTLSIQKCTEDVEQKNYICAY
jgi:hypothetical protein